MFLGALVIIVTISRVLDVVMGQKAPAMPQLVEYGNTTSLHLPQLIVEVGAYPVSLKWNPGVRLS
jgi:hypothetical protein